MKQSKAKLSMFIKNYLINVLICTVRDVTEEDLMPKYWLLLSALYTVFFLFVYFGVLIIPSFTL